MQWKQGEREALAEYVRTSDPKKRMDWIGCAKAIKAKSARQCYDFYTLQHKQGGEAKPERHIWTQQDNERIAKRGESGQTWSQFQAEFFPNLALGQLKNQAHKLRAQWNVREMAKQEHSEYGEFLSLMRHI